MSHLGHFRPNPAVREMSASLIGRFRDVTEDIRSQSVAELEARLISNRTKDARSY